MSVLGRIHSCEFDGAVYGSEIRFNNVSQGYLQFLDSQNRYCNSKQHLVAFNEAYKLEGIHPPSMRV